MTGKSDRVSLRNKVIERDGVKCCWCGGDVTVPVKGVEAHDFGLLASVEKTYHGHYADNIEDMKISHNKCLKNSIKGRI